MDTRPVRVPFPIQTGYIGPIKRYAILAIYCIYALATGVVMLAANLGLFISESLLDLIWTLHNVPANVNNMIDQGNHQIVSGEFVALGNQIADEKAQELPEPTKTTEDK